VEAILLTIEEVKARIAELRRQVDEIVIRTDDLTDPELVAKTKEIDELSLLYLRLVGQDRGVHSDGGIDTLMNGISDPAGQNTIS